MSVLFIPQACTSISTWPAAGAGVGTSGEWTSCSRPPWPISWTACMVAGIRGDDGKGVAVIAGLPGSWGVNLRRDRSLQGGIAGRVWPGVRREHRAALPDAAQYSPAMPAARRLARWSVRALLVVLVLVLVAVVGLVAWAKTGVMAAEDAPWQAVQDRPGITVSEDATALVLRPDGTGADGTGAEGTRSEGTGLVFFPGAKVEPAAYAARLADLVAEDGITVVIAKPWLGLALLDRRDLETFTAAADDVETRMAGGHSLGGVRACQLAADADALVLLGSYCANGLSATDLPVLSISGSEDGLSTPQKIDDARDLLPDDARMLEIPGA